MVQNEVTNHVGALDDVLVVVEGIKKPRIMFCNELARAGVCPQHVLAEGEYERRRVHEDVRDVLVGHHVTTDFGNIFPLWRKSLRLPGLVEDAWNALHQTVLCSIPTC